MHRPVALRCAPLTDQSARVLDCCPTPLGA
jgi:hypothetical protein